jgi:uncharacterized protein
VAASASEVVRGIFAAISRGDLPGLMSLLDEHIVVDEPESLPCGGVHRGLEAFRNNVLMVMGKKFAIRALRCEVIGEGDTVAASADIEFTSRSTGKILLMPYVELHTVKDGKSRYVKVFPQDTHRLVNFWREN